MLELGRLAQGVDQRLAVLEAPGMRVPRTSADLEDVGQRSMLASDQRVAIIARTTGRLGSQRLENDFVQVMRFDGETVSEVWNYNWDQQALAAAMPATAAA